MAGGGPVVAVRGHQLQTLGSREKGVHDAVPEGHHVQPAAEDRAVERHRRAGIAGEVQVWVLPNGHGGVLVLV
ncbi:MAG: hypothetical protein M3Q47_07570, partial [Actinomycetota bacterium]|nr:hypothetical protein [Actinomycetota bacterium]